MSDDNLAEIRDEKAKKIQHPKGEINSLRKAEFTIG